jgi:sulfur transfer complex TusBCD TusB component (DsrH family)
VGAAQSLALHEGATENESTCKALIEDLVARGVRNDRSQLFVIDGSDRSLTVAVLNHAAGAAWLITFAT